MLQKRLILENVWNTLEHAKMATSHQKKSTASSFQATSAENKPLNSQPGKSPVDDDYLEEVEEIKLMLKKTSVYRKNIDELHSKTTPTTKIRDQQTLDAVFAQIGSQQAELRRLNQTIVSKLDVLNDQDARQKSSTDPYSVQRMQRNVTVSLNKMLSNSLLEYQEQSAVHRQHLRTELQKAYASHSLDSPDLEKSGKPADSLSSQTAILRNTKAKLDNLDGEIKAINGIFQKHPYCAPQNQDPAKDQVENAVDNSQSSHRASGIGFCGVCCGFFSAIGVLFWACVTCFFAIIGFVVLYRLFFV